MKHLWTEVMFRHLLAVSTHRAINLENGLQPELAVVPLSLFCDDGSFRKTSKSNLAKKLETACKDPVMTELPTENICKTAYLIDGIAMVQSLNKRSFNAFNDLAGLVLQQILASNVCCVAIIFE